MFPNRMLALTASNNLASVNTHGVICMRPVASCARSDATCQNLAGRECEGASFQTGWVRVAAVSVGTGAVSGPGSLSMRLPAVPKPFVDTTTLVPLTAAVSHVFICYLCATFCGIGRQS